MTAEQVSTITAPGLSSAQRRLWLAYKVDPASAEFTVSWAARLRGALDPDALGRAWRTVLDRHAELRLRLAEADGEPSRSHWPSDDFTLPVREVPADDLPAELDAAVGRVFDLIGGRLIGAELLRVAPADHLLVVSAHHAVLDGRSMTVIMRDLFSAYDGQDLGDPSCPYEEYIGGEPATVPPAHRIDAWAEELRMPDAPEPLGFAPATRSADRTGSVIRLPLAAGTWQALRELCRRHRTTPQVAGLAAFALTLSRYTDTDDLLIGGTMDTRAGAFADTVGMFVNPTPVRVRIEPGQPVSALLQGVHRSLLRSHTHRTVPFELVVRRLQTVPDVTRTPVFQVLFNYEPRESVPDVPHLGIEIVDLPARVAMYDLTLVLRDRGPGAELAATYRSSRYSAEQIRQFVRHVAAILEEMLTDDRSVGTLEMLSGAEREQQLAAGTGADIAGDLRPVPEIFAELASGGPDRSAVVCGPATLTYGELDRRSADLAAGLVARGVGRQSPVGILLAPSAESVVAALAVLRAGGTYVPLHPDHPQARISAVLADAGVKIVIADPAWRTQMPGVEVLSPHHADRAEAPVTHVVQASDAAYIIYTSGSTGEPKGVVVEHASLAASTAARRQTYGGHGTFLLLSPLSFDSSMAGLWGTLTSGGCLVVAETEDVRDPRRIVALIETHSVTETLCIPALYAGVLDAAERVGTDRLRSLQVVITAGEPLPEALLERHFQLNGSAVLVNEYGPTEATVWSTYHRFAGPMPVGIGGPAPGAGLYVLDRYGRLMPWGTSGQLHVGGSGVARGYLGRPESTDLAFVADPFAGTGGARMYRTGDWVRWSATSGLRFVGRRDQLVKVRGHRVELGAVETLLRSSPGITDAAVLLDPKGTGLVAFLTAGAGHDEAGIRDELGRALPPPMVPSVLRVVPELPRTPHGKVDYDALRALGADAGATAPEEPVTGGGADVRAAVRASWCEVLEVSSVPDDVNFFDAGGHSLLVPSLQMEIEDRLDIQLAIVDLFAMTTVDAQVALISMGGDGHAEADSPAADPREARLASARARRAVQGEAG
ncbi:amino acid adenylation domain-containing protein [Nonomuraea typhae]|uniref:Amino acid adenylation domain-containing protein n=1 Tax=Nonomuraea typhae TaxID=2603600 RepID=A0ABW7Z8J3_9ACTN